MKQKSSAPSSLVFMLVALTIIGNASASPAPAPHNFPLCYGGCILKCIVFGSKTPCAMDCLHQCYVAPSSEAPQVYYRNLGCAVSNCAKYGDDTKAVNECVADCEMGKLN